MRKRKICHFVPRAYPRYASCLKSCTNHYMKSKDDALEIWEVFLEHFFEFFAVYRFIGFTFPHYVFAAQPVTAAFIVFYQIKYICCMFWAVLQMWVFFKYTHHYCTFEFAKGTSFWQSIGYVFVFFSRGIDIRTLHESFLTRRTFIFIFPIS